METGVKKWQVVLDAAKPPACGDWVAVSGVCPGEEETVRFLFLDGTQAEGFTFSEGGQGEADVSVDSGKLPWLQFPDCMQIVGVERQDWRPPSWPHDKDLWRLTVISLPSNTEFERKLLEGQEGKRGILSRFGL